MSEEKIIDRIKKILAIANCAGATEAERDTAMKMAHNLMAKYNLSMASVTKSKKEGREHKERQTGSYPWVKCVCDDVAKLFFCSYFSTKVGSQTRHTFIGLESNVQTAYEMSMYVIKSIEREARRKKKEGAHDGNWERSFCVGAQIVISRRCAELRAAAEKESEKAPELSSGTALVLASLYDSEKAANSQYVVQVLGVKLVTQTASKRNIGSDAMAKGMAYGKTVGLNKQIN